MSFETDSKNNTCLITACYDSNYEVVKELLSNGVDNINHCVNHNSALSISCSKKNIDIVKLLLQFGAKIDNRLLLSNFFDNETREQNIQIIRLLMQYGADPNEILIGPTTLLCWCIGNKYNELFDDFVKYKVSFNEKSFMGTNAVNVAIATHNFNFAIILLNHGIDFVFSDYLKYDISSEKNMAQHWPENLWQTIFNMYFYKIDELKKIFTYCPTHLLDKFYEKRLKILNITKHIIKHKNYIYEKPGNIISQCAEANFNLKNNKSIPDKLKFLFDIKNNNDLLNKISYYT